MRNLKKVPSKQLEKFSNIFTQLGLVLVLFIVYVTLEHQTEKKTVIDFTLAFEPEKVYMEPRTEILFTKEVKIVPKVAVLKVPPFIIDAPIEKGKDDAKETTIDLPKDETLVVNPSDILEIDIPEETGPETVPFIMLQNAPVFKGCEGLSKEENKVCFDKKMKQFVRNNFDAGLANEIGLNAGKYKIQTQFLIDEKGNVTDIKIRAPHNRLKKETESLIRKLPKFTPGKQQNKTVRVRYTLPISFSVE